VLVGVDVGVLVGVAVGGSGVLVGVAVGVAVAGSGVLVGVLDGVSVGIALQTVRSIITPVGLTTIANKDEKLGFSFNPIQEVPSPRYMFPN
jgi:hypothetical protein